MMVRIFLITILIMVFSSYTNAQEDCGIKIDTARILANKNLSSFINVLQSDNFILHYNKQEIPTRIQNIFYCLLNDTAFANPNDEWQSTDMVIGPKLPIRKLLFFGQSANAFFIIYKTGGMAAITHVMLFRFQNKKILVDINNRIITDFWTGTIWEEPITKQTLISSLTNKENEMDEDNFLNL